MPLDHFIPQVYLKNFYSPKLGKLMYAIRKSDLKIFTPYAKSVCRIEDGSTNKYLKEARLIEEFLKGIEPKYNKALSHILNDNIDPECIYVIAGFVAYISSCSPAFMRIQSEYLRGIVEHTTQLEDSHGRLPTPPPELGGKTFTDLLQQKKIFVEVDGKFPQAFAIANILSAIKRFGNFKWDILINPFDDNTFFTSDFPVAIEQTNNPLVLNRIVPLSPYIAIRICPDLSVCNEHLDFTFSHFRKTRRNISLSKVMSINKLIVRCAETTVFFRDNHDWVRKFVSKNANYRIESEMVKFPTERGHALFFPTFISEIKDN